MDRRARLHAARLYLVTPAIDAARLAASLDGGVDVVQLRMKDANDAEILEAAAVVRAVCAQAGVLFLLNDRPDLVATTGADGVHVGQDDASVADARAVVGEKRLVGLSTHSPEQVTDAHRTAGHVDYIGVGPVHATPTKPGRDAVGLELVTYAAAHATLPWFAIGGIDAGTVTAVRDAGACRVAVVRAITEAADPGAAARALRTALTVEAPVGVA